jgi:hypothetical protein
MVETQVSLITSITITFILTLFGLIGALSLLRRWRDDRRQRELAELAFSLEVTQPNPAVQDDETQPVPVDPDPTPKRNPIPPHLRLPVQPGTPEQVVLSIEPVEGPTREQQSVQRLIDHLKKETPTAEPIQRVG